jgi:hypothetical protein
MAFRLKLWHIFHGQAYMRYSSNTTKSFRSHTFLYLLSTKIRPCCASRNLTTSVAPNFDTSSLQQSGVSPYFHIATLVLVNTHVLWFVVRRQLTGKRSRRHTQLASQAELLQKKTECLTTCSFASFLPS